MHGYLRGAHLYIVGRSRLLRHIPTGGALYAGRGGGYHLPALGFVLLPLHRSAMCVGDGRSKEVITEGKTFAS